MEIRVYVPEFFFIVVTLTKTNSMKLISFKSLKTYLRIKIFCIVF